MKRVLFVGLAALSLATLIFSQDVRAQKGKPIPQPAPVWTVHLPTEGSGASIYGPPEGLTDNGSQIIVRAAGPSRDCDCSQFYFAVNTPWVGSGPFIGFAGIEPITDEYGNFPYLYLLGGPTCALPSFDENGFIQPALPGPSGPGCHESFLSHKHPQSPYGRAYLSINLKGVDVMSLPMGQTVTALGHVLFHVAGTDCFTDPVADKVYYNGGTVVTPAPPPIGEFVSVFRSAENTWDVTINRSIGIAEANSTAGRKRGGCVDTTTAVSFTKPLSATMRWSVR